MPVFRFGIDMKPANAFCLKAVFGEHAENSQLERTSGEFCYRLPVGASLKLSWFGGVAVVDFLFRFIPGDLNSTGVDYYHMVAGINMRGVLGPVFAHQ